MQQAGLALAELALGDVAARAHGSGDRATRQPGRRSRDRTPAPADDAGAVHAGHAPWIGNSAKLTDLAAGDTLRFFRLNGEEGQLSRPVATGPGPKAYNEIDLHLMRRCVLRVFVECARQNVGEERLLKLSPRAPGYKAFRDWTQRFPAGDRALATEIGQALRASQPLSVEQATLWAEISDRDLDEMFVYLMRLRP